MASRINLTIYKNGEKTGIDITQLVESIKWSGRRGSPTRTLTVSLLDDDGYRHQRSGIDVEEGWQCIFKFDGVELFRGIFMTQTNSNSKTGEYKAYDNGIYLSNNRDTFVYESKTATDVFKDVCTRFGLPTGDVASCSYTIPDLTKKKTTGWDVIEDALSLEFENTGTRFFVVSDKGALSLRKRKENILQWVLEVGANITKYKYTKSIENVKTRIKLLSDEGTVLAEASDTELEKKIGIMQDIDTPDETLNSAQITELAKSLLNEKKTPSRKLSLNDTLGLPDVISGVGVFVIIPHISISRTLYVDSDTHTFKDNKHTMSLQLSYASDIGTESAAAEAESDSAEATSDASTGDTVNFTGGYHYVSSTSSTPTGGVRKAGKAKITYRAPGAAHPYHLVGGAYDKSIGGDCNVYGWVDAANIS